MNGNVMISIYVYIYIHTHTYTYVYSYTDHIGPMSKGQGGSVWFFLSFGQMNFDSFWYQIM